MQCWHFRSDSQIGNKSHIKHLQVEVITLKQRCNDGQLVSHVRFTESAGSGIMVGYGGIVLEMTLITTTGLLQGIFLHHHLHCVPYDDFMSRARSTNENWLITRFVPRHNLMLHCTAFTLFFAAHKTLIKQLKG